MEIIDKGQQIIANLISDSSQIGNKMSIYNIYIPFENNVIIYNTFTKAICLCNENEYRELMQNNCSDNFDISLSKYGFLVNSSTNEMNRCNQIIDLLNNYDIADYINSYTILTTTKCNARCHYCYENGCDKFDMTKSTAKKLVDFIISNNANNIKTINLSWFGGEPLCNQEIINYICEKLKSKSYKINSTMVSNGFLFDNELIKHAKEHWNLKKVQITLDGTEDNYNRIKSYIYKDCLNPFDRVCNNIEKLLNNNIKVAIRLNATKDNIHDLYSLVKFISERFSKYHNFYVYTGIVTDYSNINKAWNTKERNDLIESRNKLEEYIYSLGLKNYIRPSKQHKVSQCIADNKHSLVVYPNGTLGKCEHFETDNIIGNIFDEKLDYTEVNNWKSRHNNEKMCNDCSYYPLCIRLVKCPAFKELRCNPTEASYYLTNLKHSIISVYKDWLKKGKTGDNSVSS